MTETSTRRRPPVVTGELSVTLEDGSTITARTDVRLATAWAEHEHGPASLAALSFGQRVAEVSAALTAIRSTADEH